VALGVRQTTAVSYELGSLLLSGVPSGNAMALVRAAAWQNRVRRLGLSVPFFIVHDLGLLFTRGAEQGLPAAQQTLGVRAELAGASAAADDVTRNLAEHYVSCLRELAESEVIVRAAAWNLPDDLVAVILARVLRNLVARWPQRVASTIREELPVEPRAYAGIDLAAAWGAHDRTPDLSFLRVVVENRLTLVTSVDQIDLDTLKVLGLMGDKDQASFMDVADLLAVFGNAEANDVVNFSLDLLPSVLETRRASGVQTFSVDGYASVERKGHIDQLVLAELAHDDEVFWQKVAENELLYYGRDKHREEQRRLHYIVVDASASMRGARTVFARGLALALVKKLALLGERVQFRFFDSRLYEIMKLDADALGAPYLLSFRSERGRNYSKVFGQLATELGRLRRDEGGSITLYIVTHGQAHVPVEAIEALKRNAYLYGVFILPSHEVTLEYLPLLDRHHVIDAETLASRQQRRARALEIVDEVGHRAEGGAAVATARPAAASPRR